MNISMNLRRVYVKERSLKTLMDIPTIVSGISKTAMSLQTCALDSY